MVKKKMTQETDEQLIRRTADDIQKLLQERGLGMQPSIQIGRIAPQRSPIIAAGNTETGLVTGDISDNDRAMLDALRPIGDKING